MSNWLCRFLKKLIARRKVAILKNGENYKIKGKIYFTKKQNSFYASYLTLEYYFLMEKNICSDFRGLMRLALSIMLPVAPVVTRMIARHLPSPIEGQLRRGHLLYKVDSNVADETEDEDQAEASNGNKENTAANTNASSSSTPHAANDKDSADFEIFDNIREANVAGGVMAFVAKRVEFGGRAYSLARILSGTLKVGAELRQLAPDSDTESRGKVSALALVVGAGRDVARVEQAQAGNLLFVLLLKI